MSIDLILTGIGDKERMSRLVALDSIDEDKLLIIKNNERTRDYVFMYS